MEYQPSINRKRNIGGTQTLYRFEGSSHGASVVQGFGTYGGGEGLWELAVIYYKNDEDWDICYCTPITDDVMGHLTKADVQEILSKIDALGERVCTCPNKEERRKQLRTVIDALKLDPP